MVAVCGNGIAEGNEQCDDGNTTAGDGCSANCQLEAPGNCSAEVINLIKGQKVTIDGSNVGSTDTFKGAITGTTGNCGNGNWTGPDEIYAVMAKDGGTLTVSANVSYNNSMLHVRSQCPGEPADQLACEYRTSPGTLSWTLQLNQDTAYYVAVDAFTATGGSFQVTFELQ